MMVRASAHAVLILAAGLFVCSAGPSQAASVDDASTSSKPAAAAETAPILHKNLRHAWHHRKTYAHGRSNKPAPKISTQEKTRLAGTTDGNETFLNLPSWVTNANAQLQSAGSPSENISAMPAQADNLPQEPADAKTDNGIVTADQLNDVDRALQESNTPASLSAMASANPPAAATTARHESSAWDQTSLIGKIFIGFGALLTMASAARMFMA